MSQPIIVITGASSGIGKEIALGYSKTRPCRLVLAARNKDKLMEVAHQCEGYGSEVLVQSTDVAIPKQCEQLIKETIKRFGGIDKLILNAGVSMHQPFKDLPDLKVFHQLMQINYFGSVYPTFYALPYLRQSKDPQIVVVGSLSGEIGVPLRTGYCGSKYALRGFFESLRTEIGDKVPITLISPNYVDTNIRKNSFGPKGFQPVKKMMSAEECAQQIVEAADEKKRKVVLTLSGKTAVWLYPFLPGFVDSIVKKKATGKEAKL